MNFIKDKEWMLKNINNSDVRIIDCRFSLAEPEKGSQEYQKNHLPGAVYFHLEKDLSSPVSHHGGRHPMPKISGFVGKLEKAGINQDTIVVAYDQGEGAYAARFWWMLQYLGHENVYVLEGGFKGWLEANYPLTAEVPSFAKGSFIPSIKSEWLASVEEVKAVVQNRPDNIILIDSREEKRYLGIEEPIDKKAGHIPGAINKPWFEGLKSGFYKSAVEQKQRFFDIDPNNEVIVYCGSGVTAVPNFITLKQAGFPRVKLYLGSFSDWISYEENEIE
ncbi:sulfurtransferase [Neobacillus niacini]|uniref:sulfurtransferase n=1 Tax=Neobacillus niacini TaxID=86668 RepID=UPI002860EC0A|nr:sulfurtransferase [Neobacillus niacini]MDR6998138.1 thiosulfate/3-mercaptopyruvate sulfurtransferase [Neobacillus niacini]